MTSPLVPLKYVEPFNVYFLHALVPLKYVESFNVCHTCNGIPIVYLQNTPSPLAALRFTIGSTNVCLQLNTCSTPLHGGDWRQLTPCVVRKKSKLIFLTHNGTFRVYLIFLEFASYSQRLPLQLFICVSLWEGRGLSLFLFTTSIETLRSIFLHFTHVIPQAQLWKPTKGPEDEALAGLGWG